MPQWFVPYTAAALVAAALGWLALNYDPDAGRSHAGPRAAAAAGAAEPVSDSASAADDGVEQPESPAPVAPPPEPGPHVADEGAVRFIVEQAMTTDRADDCTHLYTLAMLEQIAGESGGEAVEECREEADDDPGAEDLVFNRVERRSGDYLVSVTLTGGSLDGTKLTMTVVERGPWKIDRVLNADFDMRRLAEGSRSDLREEGFSDPEADCIVERYAGVDTQVYERAFLEGRSDDLSETMLSKAVGCLGAETLREKIASGIRNGAGDDIPDEIVECVVDQLTAGKSAAELRELLEVGSATARQLGAQAAQDCAASLGAAA